MTVKFIVSNGKVYFGDRHYSDDYHSDVAARAGVRGVVGGGLADMEKRRIFGTSYGFGPYNPTQLKDILPDWQIECPSSY